MPKLVPSDINPGDELYIGSSWSIDHGETDTCGGIATVKGFSKCRDDQPKYFVSFHEIHRSVNLEYVLEHQDEWEKEYGNSIAHDCPDVPGHKCPHLERICRRCDGVGKLFSGHTVGLTFVCKECSGTGKGKIKRSPMEEALKKIKSSALRSKLGIDIVDATTPICYAVGHERSDALASPFAHPGSDSGNPKGR